MSWYIVVACFVPLARASTWQGANDIGSCGQQCKSDVDCSGCGSAGRCRGGDSITAICVDAPTSIPADPKAVPFGQDWPNAWAADVTTLTYNDFSNKSKHQSGKFYYDFKNIRQRQDYGSKVLLFLGGKDGQKSKFFFVVGGVLCFYVVTTDTVSHVDISIPRPDFMKTCSSLGYSNYSGREKVLGEWADHYTCSVDYANQTIAFQSWHSLGLESPARAGLPLALSAGDTKPTWQAPRLTTSWYSNFSVGAQAIPESRMVAPKLCLPIPGEQLLGRLQLKSLSHLPKAFENEDVREKVALLMNEIHSGTDLHNVQPATQADLTRARTKAPRSYARGPTLSQAMQKLNRLLVSDKVLDTRPCDGLSLSALHSTQQQLFQARSSDLQRLYAEDRRNLIHDSVRGLSVAQSRQSAAVASQQELLPMVRHGLCHELVMMYVHHTTASDKLALKSKGLLLPLLPEGGLHLPPTQEKLQDTLLSKESYQTYKGQVTCVSCHVSNGEAIVI